MRNRCQPGMVSNDYSAGFRLIRCAVNSCFSSRNGARIYSWRNASRRLPRLGPKRRARRRPLPRCPSARVRNVAPPGAPGTA
ncbi:hypothetical protein DP49_4635 [Burkholderia pseudomallei]|nr:hypothetical protein DP59_5530 [Burkholderia pseudomallei]KGD57776.1 hypothetical protein DP49_4635 [Burkholderia pseudomallei]